MLLVSMLIDLAGRPCLIVGGAGGGIGGAIALAAAKAGASVGVITHNPEHSRETSERLQALGTRSAAAIADVTDEIALAGAIAQIGEELGTIRHLVNVVGGAFRQYHRAAEFDMEAFDQVVARNLRYVIVACRQVARSMIDAGETGSIVNISSGAARGTPLLGAYGAAKAGLESFSRTMALEWGYRGIRVNVVSAGTIRTARSNSDNPEAAQAIPLRRRGTVDEIAAAAMFLLSDLSSYTTGEVLNVDGGIGLGSPGGEEIPAFAAGSGKQGT
jgi:3-oxoacyl-[acyl-carrier protein] reductase